MKVAYLTQYDARDINKWSGTGYHIGEALKNAGAEVQYLGPLKIEANWLIRARHFFYTRIRRKAYLGEADCVRARSYARQADILLSREGADVVLCPHTVTAAWLKTKLLVVLWPDCTFGGMVDYYPYYENLCELSLRDGNANERMALDRSRLAVFASDWAAQTAIQQYQTDPAKIRIVPYGANIVCTRTMSDIQSLVAMRNPSPCKLLFIGRIWGRKRGDLAVQVATELNQRGLPTELTLVGSLPEHPESLPAFVHPVGFVNKATAEGKAQLDRLLSESHFLIVPTRAEAYGIVFCEASSFGVPSLTTDVGGIPTVVRNGFNGHTFALQAPAADYAGYILEQMRDYSRYSALACSSFREYETRLNWRTAGQTMKSLLQEAVPPRGERVLA